VNAPKLIVSFPSYLYPVRFPREFTLEEEEQFLEKSRIAQKKYQVLFFFLFILFSQSHTTYIIPS
jgi:hypothetical protein